MGPYSLAFSTCPNDTFMFEAMVQGRLGETALSYDIELGDILHLNQWVLAAKHDIVKISYNTYGKVIDDYQLLDAGSALGHNCGPLLISKEPITIQELIDQQLPVAIPGVNTTANLLLGYLAPEIKNKVEMLFHEVMPAVAEGRAAAGLIIHENRFTYQAEGLNCIQDLGEYWESTTGLPIPLGAIVARKSLGRERLLAIQTELRNSISMAFANREQAMPYISQHAQEMDPAVMQAHIDLYVNEYSLSLGDTGLAAIKKLLQTGENMGLYPPNTHHKVSLL